METIHCHVSIKSAERFGAVASAAYRAGAVFVDERTGEVIDYRNKPGVMKHKEASFILAPDNAPLWVYERQELWNRVQFSDCKKGTHEWKMTRRLDKETGEMVECFPQLAREVEVAFPRELTNEQQEELVLKYVDQNFVSQGMIADVNIHRPPAVDGEENPHAHILLTMREIDDTRELGFSSKKNSDWSDKKNVELWRKSWADMQNEMFAELGIDKVTYHESYERRGIDKVPTIHMGAAQKIEDRDNPDGKQFATDRGQKNNDIKEMNAKIESDLAELAKLEKEIQSEQMAMAETDFTDRSKDIRADMAAEASQKRRTTAETPRRADAGPTLKMEVKQGNKQGFKKKLLREEYDGLEIDSDLLRQVRISKNMPSLVTLNDGAKVTDFGSKITTKNATENSFALMAEMARAKGWQSVVLDGEKADQIAMAKELAKRGIEVSTSDREILEIIDKAKEQSAIAPPAHATPMPGMPGTGNQKNEDDDYWRSRREISDEKPKTRPATDDEKASFRREWRSSYQINDSEQFAQTQAEIEARALQKEFDVRADYERQRQEELKRKKEQELKNQYVPKPPGM